MIILYGLFLCVVSVKHFNVNTNFIYNKASIVVSKKL